MLSLGLETDSRNNDGVTPLIRAALRGKQSAFQLLKRCWSNFGRQRRLQSAPQGYPRWKYIHCQRAVIAWSWERFKEHLRCHSTDACSLLWQTKYFWVAVTTWGWRIFKRQPGQLSAPLGCTRWRYINYQQNVTAWSWFKEQCWYPSKVIE